jgi:MinD superfamily P-loop ATPase
MKCTRIGGKTYNCSGFEIDQEMDAILLIIDIAYGVCRIVIKSVQQCRYFLFFVNLLLVGVNYGQRIMQVCS